MRPFQIAAVVASLFGGACGDSLPQPPAQRAPADSDRPLVTKVPRDTAPPSETPNCEPGPPDFTAQTGCRRTECPQPFEVRSTMGKDTLTAATGSWTYECHDVTTLEVATHARAQLEKLGHDTLVQRVSGVPMPDGTRGEALHLQTFVNDNLTISVEVPLNVNAVRFTVMRMAVH